MAWVFHTGVSPTAGVSFGASEWAWLLKELLKSIGWTVVASSNGTNVNNAGVDQITTLTEMNTTDAWYVIEQPTIARGWGRKGGRKFIIRRGATTTTWMIVYVPLDDNEITQTALTSGTTTLVPTYAKQEVLVGTLPNTTATFGSSGSSGQHRLLIGANNEAPYGFFMGAWDTVGTSAGGTFLFDPLEPDSVDVDDEDPYVVGAFNTNSWHYQGLGSVSAGAKAYWRKGLTGESFNPIAGMYYACWRADDTRIIPRDAGRSVYNKKEKSLPAWYGRPSVDGSNVYEGVGVKGTSSIWSWKNGGWQTGIRRSRFQTNDRIVLQDVLLPWPPLITPVYGV